MTSQLTQEADQYSEQLFDYCPYTHGKATNGKCHEHNRPLGMTLVDYKKAFASVKLRDVFHALRRIDSCYVDMLRELFTSATLQIQLLALTKPISIKRGVRQGDTILTKLFTAALEDAMKSLDWEQIGININGVVSLTVCR